VQVLRADTIRTVVPECDFGAGFHVSGRAHDRHIAYKCAAGVAGTAVVDIRCIYLDAARIMRLLFYSFLSLGRVPVTGLGVSSQTGDWTAEGDDSFDEKSGHAIVVSIRLSTTSFRGHNYVSTIGFASTVDVLTPL
jgi:hypothetical protein